MIDDKEKIAMRVARELKDGQLVNLGIGLPTLVANYIDPNINVVLQSENGMIGLKALDEDNLDENITNAGGSLVSIESNGAFFDSSYSFSLIRGGHVDITVLGSLEVDQYGNLANYMIPDKLVPGMGGAMDLVSGAKSVIVAMQHTSKGKPKILEKCTLPLTGVKCVNKIITELAVFNVNNGYLELVEISSDTTVENVINLTNAKVIVSKELREF